MADELQESALDGLVTPSDSVTRTVTPGARSSSSQAASGVPLDAAHSQAVRTADHWMQLIPLGMNAFLSGGPIAEYLNKTGQLPHRPK